MENLLPPLTCKLNVVLHFDIEFLISIKLSIIAIHQHQVIVVLNSFRIQKILLVLRLTWRVKIQQLIALVQQKYYPCQRWIILKPIPVSAKM